MVVNVAGKSQSQNQIFQKLEYGCSGRSSIYYFFGGGGGIDVSMVCENYLPCPDPFHPPRT